MREQNLTWKDVVRDALQELGGQAHLSDINKKVEGHPKAATNPTWQATIRRVVRQYKMFEPVPPARSGVYRLVEQETPHVERESFTAEPEVDHGIAQGMLLALGEIYGYETYVPPRDQTMRRFQGRPLGDYVTVSDCTAIFTGSRNISKIKEIDTLWFDEDDDGLFPAYAFEVEETTGVKSGLDRLLKIPLRYRVRLYIVAPSDKEKGLYSRYVNQTPFRVHRDRFSFRYYDELEKLYNFAVEHHGRRELFGIAERGRQ